VGVKMITNNQIQEIRKELQECKNPLFFFHDDADGLSSFLLLYRYVKEGHGIIIKTTPNIDEKFLRKVEEYDPDKIFILDIALVEQEFIDKVKRKIIWIDHHNPQKRHGNLKYYNPRINSPKDNIPVSYICYQVVQQDLWIAMDGCIGDWYWPDFADKFKKQYPNLLPKNINKQEDALFETKLGKLIRIMEFSLKGKTSDALKCIKIMTRIKSPYEIINQTTPMGRYITKRAGKIEQEYQSLLKNALKTKPENNLLLFHYLHGKISFTKDLSNELIHRFPDKVIIVAREKADEIKLSIRAPKINIPPILEKALQGVEGYGGGHEHACGANVKKKDFKRFIETFKKLI
jgi:single-stranded DNA-specific DHH superfamily exonuclease